MDPCCCPIIISNYSFSNGISSIQRRFWYIYIILVLFPGYSILGGIYGIYTFVAWMSHEGELLQELCHLQYRKASQVLFILHTVSSRRGCFSCWCRDIGAEQSQQTVVIRVISSVDCVSWYEHEYEHGVTVTSYQYRYEYSYAIRRTVQYSTVQYSTVQYGTVVHHFPQALGPSIALNPLIIADAHRSVASPYTYKGAFGRPGSSLTPNECFTHCRPSLQHLFRG